MLPYKMGGGLPVVGGGGSVMTHTAGSVTTQSIHLIQFNRLFLFFSDTGDIYVKGTQD